MAGKLDGHDQGTAAGWVYLQFPRAHKLCGYGIRCGASDADRDPRNWRVYRRRPLAEDQKDDNKDIQLTMALS